MKARVELGPLVWTTLAVAVAIIFLVINGLVVRGTLARSFDAEEHLRATQLGVSRLLQHQLDEETGLRGFAATRDPLFLEPLETGRRKFGPEAAALREDFTAERLDVAFRSVGDAVATNTAWWERVANPLLAHNGRDPSKIQLHGKLLVDHFRQDISVMNDELQKREQAVDDEARTAVDRIGLFVLSAVILASIAAFYFVRQRLHFATRLEVRRVEAEEERRRATSLEAAYVAEKRIADTLQDAIAQRPLPLLPRLQFSATYVPAMEEAKVGGDWYDVIELPGERVLFAIGDVAGHGVSAAVTMSRARQALIASALLDPNPASVLARVNAELLRQGTPMITAVTGYADARTYEFVYASAGHPPPMLIEGKRVPRLLAFGGVPLGVMHGAAYETVRVQSFPGATLVLYTDGAIEHSKNVLEGEALLMKSAEQASKHEGYEIASRIHEGIFHGSPAGDDVAILTIGFTTDNRQSLAISVDSAQSAFSGRVALGVEPSEVVVSLAKERLRRGAGEARLRRNAS